MQNNRVLEESSTTLIDVKVVAGMLDLSQRTVWRMIADRRIPQPLRVGTRTVRWQLSQIHRWIEMGCQSCEQESN